MDYRDNQYVVERVIALQSLLKPDKGSVTSNSTSALLRLLKKSNADSHRHVRIIKQLLDKKLFAEEGPNSSTQFTAQYEICLRTNPSLTESFLLLLKPLSFCKVQTNSSAVNLTNPLQAVGSLSSNVPTLDISNFRNIVQQTQNPNHEIQKLLSHRNHAENEDPLRSNNRDYHPLDWRKNKENEAKESKNLQQIDLELLNQKGQKPQNKPNQSGRPSSSHAVDWIPPEMEHRLILDLIYVLGGVNGSHIKYDLRSESYVIDPTLSLHPTIRDIILSVCELGWLYLRVHHYREVILQSNLAAKGLVIQAFAYALNEELIEYRRLLAVLEQEVQKSNPVHKANRVVYDDSEATSIQYSRDPGYQRLSDFEKRKEANDASASSVQTGLTLLRLKAWMQEPIERLLLMARLVDCASSLSGGALISRLHAHTRHGDMISSMFVQRIMDSVCAPIFSMLTKWIINGELNDPHREFFIGQNPANMIRNVWKDMYYLRNQQIPSFISSSLVEKILSIGKSITFIKSCLEKLPKQVPQQRRAGGSAETVISTSLTVARRSYRQINKSKKLSLYGVVVDTFEEEQSKKRDVSDDDGEGEDDDESLGDLSDDDDPWASEESESNDERNAQSLVKFSKNKKGSDAKSVKSRAMRATSPSKSKVGQKKKRNGKKGKRKSSYSTVEEIKEFLQSLQDSSEVTTSILQSIRYDGVLSFSKLIYSLSNTMDKHLVNLINDQYKIKYHLLALKKFLLLGQGDFITCLMDNIGPQLGQRASQIFRHNLLSILEGAIRSSNAQYEPSFIIDRLSVRLLESNISDTGWEVFSLDYVIDLPLNTIVHLDAMMKYRIAFHMLWRLKRVEWSLSTTWKQFIVFSHTHDHLFRLTRYSTSNNNTSNISKKKSSNNLHSDDGSTSPLGKLPSAPSFFSHIHIFLQDLKKIFHTCHLARGHMMHVVNNFNAFLMFEVMETTWMSLEKRLNESKSLNDIITAHDNYLNEILDRSLLSNQYESLQIQLQQLFNLILKFCSLENELLTGKETKQDAMAYIARERILFNANVSKMKTQSNDDSITDDGASIKSFNSSVLGGGAGRSSTPLEMHKGSKAAPSESGLSARIVENLHKTIADYHNQFQLIMSMLREETDRSNDVLRFLTFRLDFNNFHANSPQAAIHQSSLQPTQGRIVTTPVNTTQSSSLFAKR